MTVDEKYHRYLCSRDWAENRRMVIERCRGLCERCGKNIATDVHHLTYARKYNELLSDLQGICRKCHEFIHAKSDHDPAKPPPTLEQMRAEDAARMEGYRAAERERNAKERERKRSSDSEWDKVLLRLEDETLPFEEIAAILRALKNLVEHTYGGTIERPSKYDHVWQDDLAKGRLPQQRFRLPTL